VEAVDRLEAFQGQQGVERRLWPSRRGRPPRPLAWPGMMAARRRSTARCAAGRGWPRVVSHHTRRAQARRGDVRGDVLPLLDRPRLGPGKPRRVGRPRASWRAPIRQGRAGEALPSQQDRWGTTQPECSAPRTSGTAEPPAWFRRARRRMRPDTRAAGAGGRACLVTWWSGLRGVRGALWPVWRDSPRSGREGRLAPRARQGSQRRVALAQQLLRQGPRPAAPQPADLLLDPRHG
jgi:hypothetical protein